MFQLVKMLTYYFINFHALIGAPMHSRSFEYDLSRWRAGMAVVYSLEETWMDHSSVVTVQLLFLTAGVIGIFLFIKMKRPVVIVLTTLLWNE